MDNFRLRSRMLITVVIVYLCLFSARAAPTGNTASVIFYDNCCIQYCRGENCIPQGVKKGGGNCSNHSLVTFEAEKSAGKKTFALADWSNGRVRLTTVHFLVQNSNRFPQTLCFLPGVRSREFFSPPVNGTQSIVKVFSSNSSKWIYALTSLENKYLGLYRFSVIAVGNKLSILLVNSNVLSGSWSLSDGVFTNQELNVVSICVHGFGSSKIQLENLRIDQKNDCSSPNVVSVVSMKVDLFDEQLVLYENERARWMNNQVLRIGARVDLEIRTGWTSLVLPIFSSAAFLLVGLALMSKYFNIHLQ